MIAMSGSPKVLVTGGAGYIGSHAVWGLREAGVRAIVLDDLSTGSPALLPSDIPLVVGDVGDRGLVGATLTRYDVSTVMHFAGKIIVAESVEKPLLYYRENVVKTHALIEACVAAGVRHVVFSSSAAVYGEPETVPIDEEAPIRPVSPYGASKAMAERMLVDAADAHGLTYLILRYFNVAGADAAGRSGQMTRGATHLIKIACEVATGKRRRLDVFGSDYPTRDGTCIRDYIHVTDLAEAHVLAVGHLAGGGASAIYNCGYGTGSSVLDVVRAMEAVTGTSLPFTLAPRRPGDPATLVAKADRIRRELGWRPRLDRLDTMIGSALAWERGLAAVADGCSAEHPVGAE
jgi:UDP-glucose 4-epimerase